MLKVTCPFTRTAAVLLLGILFLTYLPAQDKRLTYFNLLSFFDKMRQQPAAEKPALIRRLLSIIARDGVGFALTKEKEQDLIKEGATEEILAAIRANSPPVPTPTPTPTPVPTPTPPDFSFYLTRADASLGKGSFEDALADYDKAIEMKRDSAVAYLNRGRTYYSLESLDRALADYDKALQIDPKQSMAYYHRGVFYEKKGNRELAAADYQKAIEADPGNEPAKADLKRIRDAQARVVPAAPTSISVGMLSPSALARCAGPIYPTAALRANISGIVTVNVVIDARGNIVNAKAVSGPPFLHGAAEDAARRCRVQPAMWQNKPIMSTGSIQYQFSPTRRF